jgi:mono/diheme cytochrome c family protein
MPTFCKFQERKMNRLMFGAGVCLLAFAATIAAQNAAAPNQADNGAQVARGKYIVEKTGMCGDCHTPMTEKGPDMSKHLQGATLPFKNTVPVPGWAERSANIAGLKGWSDEEAIKFLTTGVDPNGKLARPPMPAFRYNKKDAQAILVYLRSLAPAENANSSSSSK